MAPCAADIPLALPHIPLTHPTPGVGTDKSVAFLLWMNVRVTDVRAGRDPQEQPLILQIRKQGLTVKGLLKVR